MSIHSAAFVCADTTASPVFVKNIFVEQPENSAIEITGLGFFELYVNGKKISSDVLVPPVSDYGERDLSTLYYPISDTFSHRVYYCRYNLSDHLNRGDNAIEIQLGNGWYLQNERTGEGKLSYGKPRLAFSLTVDGKEYLSDETVFWHDSEIVYDNIYIGETHDFRHKDTLLKPVECIDAPSGKLQESDAPHDKIIRKIRPVVIFKDETRTVYDAGINLSGVVSFMQKAAEGEETTVTHAERLKENHELWVRSAGELPQKDTYISDGEAHFCMPKFVFHGFRYFEIIGKAEDVWVHEIHTDIPVRARFSSDNAVLNFLYTASIRSLYSNMHSAVITDCPHRERLGYTGDGQLTADLAMTVLSAEKLYEKWMRDIADGQDPETGHVQHTAPFGGGGGGPGGWGGAIVIVPYMIYLHHDRVDILREYYPHMQKYIAYMESRSEDGLVVREEPKGWCLGDWCTPDKIAIPEPFVNTYFLIKCLDYMVEISYVLDDFDAPWAKKSAELRAALRRHYYDAEKNTYCDGIQGADAFAIDIGIGDVPMVEALAEKYEGLGAFDTGILGTDILIRVLFENGFGDTAMKLLTSEKENSYGAWLKRGETTLCEYWSEKASHNHHMFGAPLRYVFSRALGVDDSGGMLIIAPMELTFPITMEADMETKFGHVFIRRKISEKGEVMTIRSTYPAFFRYRETQLSLKTNEETILQFYNFSH
ncbi:MAG: family 78 glycoside hydrolase catalytic domain [Clostridia bacterium]|nr:family 78 glycoside hydrolase catalytic domain [Clostridia bacterium]